MSSIIPNSSCLATRPFFCRDPAPDVFPLQCSTLENCLLLVFISVSAHLCALPCPTFVLSFHFCVSFLLFPRISVASFGFSHMSLSFLPSYFVILLILWRIVFSYDHYGEFIPCLFSLVFCLAVCYRKNRISLGINKVFIYVSIYHLCISALLLSKLLFTVHRLFSLLFIRVPFVLDTIILVFLSLLRLASLLADPKLLSCLQEKMMTQRISFLSAAFYTPPKVFS